MKFVAPALETSAADWFVAGLRGFGESVLSVVPDGFESYVRVFHPAYRGDGEVTWAEIASVRGRRVHPGMQMDWISGRLQFENERPPDDFDRWPSVGSLPEEIAEALAAVLERHTCSPGRCRFALWNGYAGAYENPSLSTVPTFRAPYREYHLFEGPLSVFPGPIVPLSDQSFNIAWPDDHAWCLATEIDFNSTYIGCSSACAEELLDLRGIESFVIDPSTGIGRYGDALNAPPRPTG